MGRDLPCLARSQRTTDLKAFTCDHCLVPLPPGHRFPIEKYRLLREAVAASNLVPTVDLVVPEPATDDQILRAHDRAYLEKVKAGQLTRRELRRIGFPWSPELVRRTRCSVGGTIGASRAALRDGVAVNLAGGTHHAFRDHGQGYCIFNDGVIAIRTMQAEESIHRAVILDGDVHQGNGTAAIAADDPTIFTLSIHGERNFPLHKELGDLDIGLPDGADDVTYLRAWENGVRSALSRLSAELAIYLAGADPYEGDLLGRLALTKEGLAERDRLAFELCGRAGIPVATVMAGGYARHVEDTVEIHLQTVRLAAQSAERYLMNTSEGRFDAPPLCCYNRSSPPHF
jgi:acetoin utilization deacetylase AcuC-like enzyme